MVPYYCDIKKAAEVTEMIPTPFPYDSMSLSLMIDLKMIFLKAALERPTEL